MAKGRRYIEICETKGCSTKRISTEKTKSGYECYRCRRKASRKPKQEAYAKAQAETAAPVTQAS